MLFRSHRVIAAAQLLHRPAQQGPVRPARRRLAAVRHPAGKIRDIYDFGQNMSGILELEVRGNAGDTVRIYPAEKLGKNGDADQEAKGWCTVDSCITCIVGQKGVWEKFRMTFTYFAGRFVGVEKDGGAEIRNLRAHAITSAHKKDGTFSCDDER